MHCAKFGIVFLTFVNFFPSSFGFFDDCPEGYGVTLARKSLRFLITLAERGHANCFRLDFRSNEDEVK